MFKLTKRHWFFLVLALICQFSCKKQTMTKDKVDTTTQAVVEKKSLKSKGKALGNKLKLKPVKKPLTAKAAANPKPAGVTSNNGEIGLGGRLSGIDRVKVSSLVENPKKFMAKDISMVGEVVAMCPTTKHWFSMVDDKSGAQVRVYVAPKFLVPATSVGLAVQVEGKVEILKTTIVEARRLTKEHKIPMPKKVSGATYDEVILRAKVARFR